MANHLHQDRREFVSTAALALAGLRLGATVRRRADDAEAEVA
jgi:hypothetical protein